jgi:hypothetical protein
MIIYQTSCAQVTAGLLQGFFVGWPNPPSPARHLALLHGSSHVVLAIARPPGAADGGPVVGFITAISDGVLAAYIPLLEVLPELVRRMQAQLQRFYMVDLLCDPEVQPFYERLGLHRATGMLLRNYDRQSGE